MNEESRVKVYFPDPQTPTIKTWDYGCLNALQIFTICSIQWSNRTIDNV